MSVGNPSNQSVFFLTLSTSGTASMLEIYQALMPEPLRYERLTYYLDEQIKTLQEIKEELSDQGFFYLWNFPDYAPKLLADRKQLKFLLNLRDPRDWFCNLFHFSYQHHLPEKHPEKENEAEYLERKRAEAFRKGIDQWILDRPESDYMDRLNGVRFVVENYPPEAYLFNSYAMLCLHFDDFVARAAEFLGVEPDEEAQKKIEQRRGTNLPSDPTWVGHQWSGCDVMPGRYKRELRVETIHELNRRYQDALEFLADIDDPRVAHTYERE